MNYAIAFPRQNDDEFTWFLPSVPSFNTRFPGFRPGFFLAKLGFLIFPSF
jgi:hypothetical protein